MPRQKNYHSSLNACRETLEDFAVDELGYNRRMPTRPEGGFAPYTLNGPQVGAVIQLLAIAERVFKQRDELEIETGQSRNCPGELQEIVDQMIADLDPDGQD